jgi:ABC-type polar amino acid transport system ATPase subunit
MIDIKNLRQKYHRAYVIDGLDLTLQRHGMIAS